MDIVTIGWIAVMAFFVFSLAFLVWGRGGM
ncbi:cytochrome b6-f complex subunit PetN [Synechococcus sp. PCC 7336]|nr:cytochrome b6-f complex subunit PetN [Synechococcus sp. PCC 7336]